MRKLTLLLALFLLLMGMGHAWSETLTEDFNNVQRLDANGNVITSNYTYGSSLSNGWIASAPNIIGASNSYHYGIASDGNEGMALWAGYGATQNYYMIIPTQLVGEVKFQARKTSSNASTYGYISLYEATESNGTFTVTSTKLGETISPTSNSIWNNYSINIGEEPKYVALHMIRCGLDNFEATIYVDNGAIARPNNFIPSNITINSVDLTWTAGGEETAWQLVYDTNASFDKDAATPIDITTNPYTLSGLNDNTTYYAYLRAKIGDDVSNWISTSFTTLLAPISSFPWLENFNSLTAGIPAGWNNTEGTTTTNSYKWNYYATGKDGACVRFDSYNNTKNYTNFLKTPVMNFTAGTTMKLSFWYKNPKGGDFSVYISNDGGATYTTELTTGLTGATNWTEQVINIPSEFVNNVVIVFKGTSNYGSGDAYIYLDDVEVKEVTNNPATMEVTLDGAVVGETVAFGSVKKANTKTLTVANDGDQTLNVTEIAVSGTDASCFTVSSATLEVAGGQTGTFDLTFTPTDEENVEKTATITLTAGELTKSFTVTGTYVNLFSEDFEGGEIPEGWDSNGFVVKMGSVGSYPVYNLPTYFAVGNGGSAEKTIVTPLLQATEGDKLTFDGFFYYSDETLKVDYSTDRTNWNNLYTYDKSSYENGSTHEVEITAPITGEFYLRFTVNYYNGIDNIVGFKLATAKEHEAEITTTTIPATGNQYVEYTASVDVKVLGTSDEELTAKFFIGDTQYGEDVVKIVTSGETETFTVTFTPDAAVSGDAYFTITNNDIDLTTEPTAVTIVGAYALSEADTENNVEEGNYPVVELTFTVKNGWNSIALPFDVSDPTVFGESVRVYSLDSFAEGTLSFSEKNTMYGCDPYIIYVEGAKTGPFLFNNVSISSSQANESNCYTTTPPGEYTAIHKGTWTKMSADGLYGIVNATGDIRLGTSNATFKAFRSYFDLTYPEGSSIKMSFVNNDGVSTTINAAEVLDELNGDIYDMSGRKVSKVQKGIYIQNGKKVVIK